MFKTYRKMNDLIILQNNEKKNYGVERPLRVDPWLKDISHGGLFVLLHWFGIKSSIWLRHKFSD